MNIGGINLSDDDLKLILAEKELIIITVSRLLDGVNRELNKGYNMKLTKLPDGRIVLEPEGSELEVLEWVEQNMGSTALQDQINKFVEQRKQQKDYDELMNLGKELKELEPEERIEVIHNLKSKVQIARMRKTDGGLEPTPTK